MTVIAVDITDQPITVPNCAPSPGEPVWTRVRPNIRRTHTVATDVLAALGKRRDLAGKGRNEHEDIQLAIAWLKAYEATDLVLLDAQHFGSKVLGNIARLAEAASADLWLLHRPPAGDIFIRALHRHAQVTKTIADVPAPTHRPGNTRAATGFAQVPRHDIHQFRAVVEATLTGRASDTVLACLDDTARTAYLRMSPAGATPAVIADVVDDLLLDAPGDDELITRVRGVQLAAWQHDVFVRVDLDALLNSEERPTLAASAVDDALAAYRQPHRILTVALTRRGHSLDAIAGLRCSDVLDDGRRLHIGNRIVDVAGEPARALRVATGLAEGERLMPYAPQTLAAMLTDATKDLGLHVKGRRAERTRPKHTAFLRRLGITLRALP
jgi:hypothetical protein